METQSIGAAGNSRLSGGAGNFFDLSQKLPFVGQNSEPNQWLAGQFS
jgi:hypothetical protein